MLLHNLFNLFPIARLLSFFLNVPTIKNCVKYPTSPFPFVNGIYHCNSWNCKFAFLSYSKIMWENHRFMRMCTHMCEYSYACVYAWAHICYFLEQFSLSALSLLLFTCGFSLYVQVQLKGLILGIQMCKLCFIKSL